jgi:hypothetical protein
MKIAISLIVANVTFMVQGRRRLGFRPREKKIMDTTQLIILILVLVFLFGGGGFYWSRRGR